MNSCPFCRRNKGKPEFMVIPRPTFINKDKVYCCSEYCFNKFKERGFERKKINDIICYVCKEKFDLEIIDKAYVVYSSSFLRSKSNINYCCSQNCEDIFQHLFKPPKYAIINHNLRI